MTIIVIILAILLGSYVLLAAVDRVWAPGRMSPELRGRVSLALVFAFTGLGHFIQAEPMARMLPPWVPARVEIIHLTGLLEWAGAAGLLVPRFSRAAGICLVLFLVLVLPSNVYAALNRVEMGGHALGPVYLLARAPLQLILIAWTWWFAVRKGRP
jgi:uncharacterized membrane protein